MSEALIPDRPRLRREEASTYLLHKFGLEVAASTLAKYATVGGGPRYNKAGRLPLYPVTELDSWAERRLGALVESTTEAEAAARG